MIRTIVLVFVMSLGVLGGIAPASAAGKADLVNSICDGF
jgi:hypothetical protein